MAWLLFDLRMSYLLATGKFAALGWPWKVDVLLDMNERNGSAIESIIINLILFNSVVLPIVSTLLLLKTLC